MTSTKAVLRLGFLAVGLLCLPPAAYAQSAIAGVVKDATGAVVPGVTVEAASPALIEGTRTVATDAAGLYKIIDLRPGTYTVTFTLAGFSAVKREGLELPANFTATVNADMKIGAVEESVTVSGQSPVVDLQNPAAQQVLARAVVDAVPTGRSVWAVGALVPSVQLSGVDVGGSRGMQQLTMAVHGSDTKDTTVQVDGMALNSYEEGVQQYYNDMMFEEFNYQTSAVSAETAGGGVRLNMIPKEGGNVFKGTLFYSGEPHAFVGNNLGDLPARGLKAANPVKTASDLSGAIGGPIAKDKLWFFFSTRRWGVDNYISNAFYNLDSTRRTYIPADGQNLHPLNQVVDNNLIKSFVLRLTDRVGPHKFAAYLDRIIKFRGHEGSVNNAEETFTIRTPRIYYTGEAKYTGTLTNKLLVETGLAVNNETYTTQQSQSEVLLTDIGRTDLSTNVSWAAPQAPYERHWPIIRKVVSASVSYVTGSHALKTGIQYAWGEAGYTYTMNGGIDYIQQYRNGISDSVQVWNTPVHTTNLGQDTGIYAQDSWTLKRLTLSPGVRIDLFNSYFPALTSPAGTFVPARSFPAEADIQQPHFKDINPRIGGVYDLFGDNKTALKASWGRYVTTYNGGFSSTYNPTSLSTDQRTWTDLNHDDIAQYGPLGSCGNPSLYCEIGPSTNVLFGTVAQHDHAPGIKRPYNYETSISVQRQIVAGMSVNGGYTRRDYHNIIFTQNLVTQPLGAPFGSGYTAVQIPNPIAPGQTLTVFNLNPALNTLNLLDQTSPTDKRWFQAWDLGFTSRVYGGTIFGGASWGKQILVTCDGQDPNYISNSGQTMPGIGGVLSGFCDQSKFGMPFRALYKLSGSYPLPLDIQYSATFQSYPGGSGTLSGGDTSVNENYNVSAKTFQSLTGQALTQSSVIIRLLQPGTKYLERVNTVDMRLSKIFKFGRAKVAANFDGFNIFNKNPVTSITQTYGTSYGKVTGTIPGRLFAIGGRLDF